MNAYFRQLFRIEFYFSDQIFESVINFEKERKAISRCEINEREMILFSEDDMKLNFSIPLFL